MKDKLGLSLSGGGFRAAAFHLGTLRYLNKAKILQRIDYFSTVSGGSIIGAYYCLKIDSFSSFLEFENQFRSKLQKSVIGRVLRSYPFLRLITFSIFLLSVMIYFIFFTLNSWVAFVTLFLGLILFVRFQFRLFPVSEVIEKIYNEIFFGNANLPELSKKPHLIINSTNLQSGRLFYFTRDKMSDSTYDGSYTQGARSIFKNDKFSISKAVMCSSCVPSFFTPVEVTEDYFIRIDDTKKIKPVLVDGGIYDNQGIHKLTHPGGEFECRTVIVSDAGNNLPFEGSYNNILTLLLRTVELFMNRIKLFQMMINLYRNNENKDREIAYITLGWNLENLIPGFVQNLRNGNISKNVRNFFHLSDEFINTHSNTEIESYMMVKIDLSKILLNKPSDTQIKIARSVSTNLTALRQEEIEALSRYAEVMTEIQINLYAPHILKT